MNVQQRNSKWLLEADGRVWMFNAKNIQLFLMEVRECTDIEVVELLDALSEGSYSIVNEMKLAA